MWFGRLIPDTRGRRFAYHMHKTHPNDGPGTSSLLERSGHFTGPCGGSWAHLSAVHRPGQVRGSPWLGPGLWESCTISTSGRRRPTGPSQQIAALFAGFIMRRGWATNKT